MQDMSVFWNFRCLRMLCNLGKFQMKYGFDMQGAHVLGKLCKCKCKVTFWRLTEGDENDPIV